MSWQFSLAGLLVGILVGLTGMGGGSLMTAILIILSGLKLLEVPEAKWVLVVGIVLVLGGLCAYASNAWLARPRPAPALSFD